VGWPFMFGGRDTLLGYVNSVVAGVQQWQLRYHGTRIDSVWKSRSFAGTLQESLVNLYIF